MLTMNETSNGLSDLTFRYEKNIYPILLSESRRKRMLWIYIYIIRRGIKVHASEIDTAVIHLYATTVKETRVDWFADCSLERKWTIR